MQYLGIDLGTSAVKVMLVTEENRKTAKCQYDTPNPRGWCHALKNAIAQLGDLTGLTAIALSSQVGTYLTDTGEVIAWDSAAGAEELSRIQAVVTETEWIDAIGMDHPNLISYPIPRLLYIQKHFPHARQVMMPKELLLRELTGNAVTDIFSWRGLCHPEKQAYAHQMLEKFGIDLRLPPLQAPTDLAGLVTPEAASAYGLPAGTPVYTGCNDFFAGLLGMGIYEIGTAFELSGTSEHVGIITPSREQGKFVSGSYFNGNATYGGTKASGVSCDFAIQTFGIEDLTPDIVYRNPPIFLPYLKGERAPIYDENAKGVFFGITHKTTRADMAYAVLEGVVFSLYHIGCALGMTTLPSLITGGGSAGNPVMAKLKASLFDCPVYQVAENDSSALGAAILAMTGSGAASLQDAMASAVTKTCIATPDPRLRQALLPRYRIYEKLYPTLKDTFREFAEETRKTL